MSVINLNSARKYRPDTFDKIVGQENIIATLKNQIKNNSIANSYLFYGPRGTGKTTTARVFAKAINCENSVNNDSNPCNQCKYCIDSRMNIFEIDAASNNSVDDIRNIIERIKFTPIFAKWNIFIIDEVHMLSQSAFNSFLKTLEEPPKNTLFILVTTEINKIPGTILSRCQLYNFRLIDDNIIVKELEKILRDKNIKYDIETLSIIATKAEGGLRDALSILDSITSYSGNEINCDIVKKVLNILDDDIYFKILEHMMSNAKDKVLVDYNEILHLGFSEYSFIEGLLSFFLNLYLAKNTESSKLITKSSVLINKFVETSRNIEIANIEKIIKLINNSSLLYKNAINKRLFTSILLINITDELTTLSTK